MSARDGLTPLDPAALAGADQEFAEMNETVDGLMKAWRKAQAGYELADLDRMGRIAVFMVSTVHASGLRWRDGLIAILIARLAEATS